MNGLILSSRSIKGATTGGSDADGGGTGKGDGNDN
jgi:hypothetical protein